MLTEIAGLGIVTVSPILGPKLLIMIKTLMSMFRKNKYMSIVAYTAFVNCDVNYLLCFCYFMICD